MQELATRLGMRDSIGDCLSRHRLRWLGHLSRMDGDRLPKQILFAEGIACRPRHGPKKRWPDSVMWDLQSLGVSDGFRACSGEGTMAPTSVSAATSASSCQGTRVRMWSAVSP